MKKSTRILSVILALTMLLGVFSVMGSAYQAYRGAAITSANGYDDLDKPTFTTEQYATMALEALEKLLAEKKIYLSPEDLLELTDEGLDLRTINTAITSVAAIYNTASNLLSIAGDAGALSINALYVNGQGTGALIQRGQTGNTTDVNVILAVLHFLEDNKTILTKYVGHTLSLGAVQSLAADYLFDVRQLAFKALYHVMNDDYDILDGEIDANNKIEGKYDVTPGSGALDVMLADLVNYALIGKHTKVGNAYVLPNPEDYEGLIWEYLEDLPASEVDQILASLNINANTPAYDFIENLLVSAFNYIAVPVLNDVTRPWLREVCGVTYDKDKMNPESDKYVENYDGEYQEGDLDEQLAAIFDVDGMHIPKYDTTFPGYDSTKTFIGNFNAYFGYVLECVLNGSAAAGDWTWDNSAGDSKLLSNICSVARFVLKGAGDKFFEPYITVPTEDVIDGWNNQQTVAFVLRVILNESVSWMYIDDSQQTIADVCYAAVEQLAWQDLPQLSYTKPVRTNYANDYSYYVAIVNQALNILMDVAAYNINHNMDMVPGANGKLKNRSAVSPAENVGSGLLEYSNNYETLAIQIATWGVHNYAGMLTAPGCTFANLNTDPNNNGTVGNVTAAQVWADIDTIINALIPIKGNTAWIHGDIANQNLVFKSLLFDYLVYPILNIEDVSNLEKVLSRNTSGELASHTTKKAIIDLVSRVINAIFPGTVANSYNSLDALVVNGELAGIIGNLIDSLNDHGADWIKVALPVVCDILGFTDAQKFGEMECYMPEIVSVSEAKAGFQFEIYNGSSGINTGYTNSNGNFTQDALYDYEITQISVASTTGTAGYAISPSGNSLQGGDFKNITVTCSDQGSNTFKENSIITLNIKYKVKNETGGYIADGSELVCTKYCYVDSTAEDDSEIRTGSSAGSGYTVNAAPSIYANKGRSLGDALGYSIAVKDDAGTGGTIKVSNVSSAAPWIEVNPDAEVLTEQNAKLTWALSPFKVKDGYVRFSESYNVANVNSGNFATYGNTEENPTTRGIDLYTRNANGYTYTLVPQSAEYDASKTYYTYTSNVDHTANNVEYTENDDIIVRDGTYTASFIVTTPAGSSSARTVTIFLYDDKGLASLYNNAVAANRQSDNFTNASSEFNTYKSALDAAGLLVLDPKTVSNFPSKLNQYASKYAALYQAIEALDKKAKTTGTDSLQQAIAGFVANAANNGANYSNNYYIDDAANLNANYLANGNEPEKTGWNNVQYWATTAGGNGNSRYAYSYFGIRDYVGHDYKKFRDARDNAQSLIDSQIVYPPIEPENPGQNASVYETNKYLEAMEAYNEEYNAYLIKLANKPALNPVSVAYALHKVTLTGNRLIELQADKSKLTAFRNTYEVASQGNYSISTWEEYTLAKGFADYTIGDPGAKPEQVTEALSQYVRAYKRLCKGVDYTALDEQIVTAAGILGTTVTDVAASIDALDAAYSDAQAIVAALEALGYTEESATAFANAFVSAIDTRKADLGDSTANEEEVAHKAATLEAAINGLTEAGGGEPVIELFDPDNLPDDYEDNAQFYRDDFSMVNVPYLDNTYTDAYLGDPDTYFVAGVGVAYDMCNPLDVFQTLDNCYAVWEANEMGTGSTGSYITIYTDEDMSEVIATYYVILYGDCDGDGTIGGLDSTFIDTQVDDYLWTGEIETMIYALAGDVDGDYSPGATDSVITDYVALGAYAINQDYANHFNLEEGELGSYEQIA